jgi:hypothetical protein
VHLLVMTGPVTVALLTGASPADIVCTCAHGGDHSTCPMHRTPADSTRCRLQSTQDGPASMLLSSLGLLVLPVTSNVTLVDAPSPVLTGYASPLPSDWIVFPEPPPPRK